jgi:tryptophan-rich sensory protein
MQSDWASENLQVIRTLMERGAVYRRALAPVMGAIGLTGLAASALAVWTGVSTGGAFASYWMAVAVACLAVAFLLVRRQALKDGEPFWSPPTRRVAQALWPAFFCGMAAGLACLRLKPDSAWLLPPVWMALYGCALHSAGFFMPRGFKLFGWAFILAGCGWVLAAPPSWSDASLAMGVFFGGAHAAYGLYLYFTEKRGNET